MNLSSIKSLIDEIELLDRSKSESELNMRFSLPSILALTSEYISSNRIRCILLLLKLRFFNILNLDNVNKLLFKIASVGANLFPSSDSSCNLSRC